MREPKHEPMVEIGKTQEVLDLWYGGWGWPIPNDLYLGWVHMYTLLINDVPHILNLGQPKGEFLQVNT